MLRETITIIIIVCLIFCGNYITEKYTKYATDTMISLLDEIDLNDNVSFNKTKMNEINANWEDVQSKMAYYIEHDELEKVENDLKAIESAIILDEMDEGAIYINQCKFVLKHIKEKYEFNLQNIF